MRCISSDSVKKKFVLPESILEIFTENNITCGYNGFPFYRVYSGQSVVLRN